MAAYMPASDAVCRPPNLRVAGLGVGVAAAAVVGGGAAGFAGSAAFVGAAAGALVGVGVGAMAGAQAVTPSKIAVASARALAIFQREHDVIFVLLSMVICCPAKLHQPRHSHSSAFVLRSTLFLPGF